MKLPPLINGEVNPICPCYENGTQALYNNKKATQEQKTLASDHEQQHDQEPTWLCVIDSDSCIYSMVISCMYITALMPYQ